MKSILLATVALAALSGSAFAADAVNVEPAPVPLPVASTFNWTGLYVGGTAGYGWGSDTYHYTVGPDAHDFDVHGFVGGLTAGYNWQAGQFVYGVEGDVSFADVKGSSLAPLLPSNRPCVVVGEGCTARVDWFGTGRARVGYAFENLLPYVTGGFAFGHVKGSADLGACGYVGACDYSDTRWGWTAGAGIEWAMNRKLSFKAEYLHVDLGTPDFTRPTVTADAIKFDTVRVGLNYHF